MQYARHAQHELRDGNREFSAIHFAHLITAGHGADLRRQHRTAGVLEALPRLDDRLLAHYALAFHFLHVIVGIGDDPVPTQQLHGVLAFVGKGDGVGEYMAVIGIIGLVGEIAHLHGDLDAVVGGVIHCRISPYFARHDKPRDVIREVSGKMPVQIPIIFQGTTMYQIAPSILSANFAKLGEEVDNVLASGADIVHFDVMDNHYVPNLTIGPLVCEALRKHGVTAPIDVHLMVKPVDRIIPDFAKAGATYITFHPEASEHIDRTIGLIKESGCKAGLVFNPATPLDILEYTLPKLDMVLLMSVNPGFGGQKFIPHVLDKARAVRKMIDAGKYNCRLEIDGGVGPANIKEVAEAGVDTFVAGSAVFGKFNASDKNHYNTIIGELRAELAKVKK